LLIAARSVPAEVRKQVNAFMRKDAEPIWNEELRGRAATRLQQRALVDSGRVGVTNRNVFLRSGSVGRFRSGTPVRLVSAAAEFGAPPTKQIQQRSRKGKRYTRRLGAAFVNVTRGGKVFWPAARDSIPRIGSVVVQTAIRTTLDLLEGKK
jgi:hypothetical protein